MRVWVAALFALAFPAFGEPADPNHCLTPEQREELSRRTIESVAVMALEAQAARSAVPLPAAGVKDNAVRALADCEASRPKEACEGARSAAKAASNAHVAARAEERAKFGREMSARAAERAKAIRAQYPNCQ